MARTIPCPICRKPVAFTEPLLPFCSERCKLIDLGAWSEEKYVISRPLRPGEALPATDLDDE